MTEYFRDIQTRNKIADSKFTGLIKFVKLFHRNEFNKKNRFFFHWMQKMLKPHYELINYKSNLLEFYEK